MKKMLAVLGVGLLVIGGGVQAAAKHSQPVVAVVNVQQLFQKSPKIANLNKKLQKKFKDRQDKLVSAQKDLQKKMDNFKRDSITMNKQQKASIEKKIADDQKTLSRDAMMFQADLGKEQKRIMSSVLAELNNIIASIAKKKGYNLVLDSQAVVYAADSNDITKDVSGAFDKKR